MGTHAGLFRIWVLCSALWLAGVGFVAWQAVAEQAAGATYIYLPGDPRRFVPFEPPSDTDSVRCVAMGDGSRLYFARAVWQRADVRRIAEDFWERRWLRYWPVLRSWLVLVVVPVVVLAGVAIVLWVFDGFRRRA